MPGKRENPSSRSEARKKLAEMNADKPNLAMATDLPTGSIIPNAAGAAAKYKVVAQLGDEVLESTAKTMAHAKAILRGLKAKLTPMADDVAERMASKGDAFRNFGK